MNNNDEIKVEVELLKKFNNKALNVIENKILKDSISYENLSYQNVDNQDNQEKLKKDLKKEEHHGHGN